MKPRPEPRAATLRDLAVAVGMLIATLVLIFVVVGIGAVLKLRGELLVSIVLVLALMYPFALNWSDMKVGFRRRRGLCLVCGYDRAGLAGDAACPECGAGPGAAE